MATEAQHATSSRERTSIARKILGWWRRNEPDFSINRDATLERWDGAGEGPATGFSFEGLGISFSCFFGRMPAFRPYGSDAEREAKLRLYYAGERVSFEQEAR